MKMSLHAKIYLQQLVYPEQICYNYKLTFALMGQHACLLRESESPNSATFGQNFLQQKIQYGCQ